MKFENNVRNLYVALITSKCRRLEGKGRILVGNFSIVLNPGGSKDFGKGSYADCHAISFPA